MDEDRDSRLLEEIRTPLAGDDGLAAAVGLLQDRLRHFSWVGFYGVEGDTLVLGPWRGPSTPTGRPPSGRPTAACWSRWRR